MYFRLAQVKLMRWIIVCFIFLAYFARVSVVGEDIVLPPPNSNGAANYYELKPNSHFIDLGVKGYQQTTDYTCGPAAVMSLLRWHRVLDEQAMNAETEMAIAKEMGTGAMNSYQPGTTEEKMADWLEKKGFNVKLGYNGTIKMLRENLRKGNPILVPWIDWGGHWVVVTGYYAASETPAQGPDTIFFADPAVHWSSVNNPDGIFSFNVSQFRDMWFDAQYLKPGNLVRNVYIIAVPKN